MKKIDVIKVLAKDLATSVVAEINTKLKAKTYKPVKYRISGESLGHYGYTGVIKAVADEGLKVFTANKVTLIRFTDMKTFDKAKPREERPVREKVEVEAVKKGVLTSGKKPVVLAETKSATKPPAKAVAKPAAVKKSSTKVVEETGPIEGDKHSKFIKPDDGYGNFKPDRRGKGTGSRFIPKARK